MRIREAGCVHEIYCSKYGAVLIGFGDDDGDEVAGLRINVVTINKKGLHLAGLFSALVTEMVAGAGFEPATSRL